MLSKRSTCSSRTVGASIAIALGLLVFVLLMSGCPTQSPEPIPTPPPAPPPPASPVIENPGPPEPAPPVIEEPEPAEPAPASEETVIIEVNADNFAEQVLVADMLVVVEFWAEWCGPCIPLKHMLVELAPQYAGQVKFVAVNLDESGEISSRYEVRYVPCLIFFKDGEEIGRLVGLGPKEALRINIDELLHEAE